MQAIGHFKGKDVRMASSMWHVSNLAIMTQRGSLKDVNPYGTEKLLYMIRVNLSTCFDSVCHSLGQGGGKRLQVLGS